MDSLDFSESGWWDRILSEMRTLIPILIGLLVVGCGEKQSLNTNEGNNTPVITAKKGAKETPPNNSNVNTVKEITREDVIGAYEVKFGDVERLVFEARGDFLYYLDGKKTDEAKWSIIDSGKRELIANYPDGKDIIMRFEMNGNITDIATVNDGERTALSKDMQITYKRVKDTKLTKDKANK